MFAWSADCVLWTEQFFEDRTEQLDLIEHDLQELHSSIELLVLDRKGMHCACTCNVCFYHL